MSAVIERSEAPDSTALIQVIERAAANPAIDVEKMERLLAMQERIMERNAKAAYSAALAQMQPDLPVITERGQIKNAKGEVQSKYALWEDINDAIRPILSRHGFALSFRIGRDDLLTTVTAVLSHREGHSEETTMSLPADKSGSKNDVQAVASSTSYGKRYTACALLNITSRGEDDDGNKAGASASIDEKQVADLKALAEEVKADLPKFLTYMKVQTLADITAKDYQKAVRALEAKRRR